MTQNIVSKTIASKLFASVFGLTVAGTAGFIATKLNIPLPWMVGPLLTIAGLSILGVRILLPNFSRQTGQIVLGTAIGLHFTPVVAVFVAQYAIIIFIAALISIAIGGLLSLLLARTGSISRPTAFFASMPGGVAEMSVLAERYGGETSLVALAQSIRVVFIVLVIPLALVLFGVTGTDVHLLDDMPLRPFALVIMLGFSFMAGYVLFKFRIINAWLIGPLVVGILIALNEWSLSQIPNTFVNAGQVLIGSALGLRFRREVVLKLGRFIPAAILNTAIMVLLSVLVAGLMGRWTSIQTGNLVLALAPGGVAEMSITAQVLQLGVPLVTAFHVIRMILVVVLSAPLFRSSRFLLARRNANLARTKANSEHRDTGAIDE